VSCTTSFLCLNSCMVYACFLSVLSSFYAHLHVWVSAPRGRGCWCCKGILWEMKCTSELFAS
jgi:hypothetical protein